MSAPPPWIPSGYVLKSICGTVISLLSSATAKCWLSWLPRPLTSCAAVGDRLGDVLERVLALGVEPERDVGAAALVGGLLRVGDLVPEQRHVVLEHVELGVGIIRVGLLLGVGVGRLQHHGPRRYDDLLDVCGGHPGGQCREEIRLARVRACDQAMHTWHGRLALLLCDRCARGTARRPERVVLRTQAGIVGARVGRLLGRELDRVVQRHAARARLARRRRGGAAAERHRAGILDLELTGGGLAVGRYDVRFPVVELQPRGLTDDLLGAVHVLDVRQADGDQVLARGLDLGLGDAELVDALAHDVDRALHRVLGDRLVWAVGVP